MLGPQLEGEHKYYAGGVLAANGKIYCAPACAGQVLCIDAETHAVEMLGPELEGVIKYQAGGVLASNGKIYCAPCCAGRVLCIDP